MPVFQLGVRNEMCCAARLLDAKEAGCTVDLADLRLVEYCLVFAVTGAVSGFASGLFGIGGGILRIPIFAVVLPLFGVHQGVEMHVAAATSLALAVPTGVMALWKHWKLGNVDVGFLRTWAVGLTVGALAGIWLAPHVSSEALKGAFIVFLALMAIDFAVVSDRFVLAKAPPGFGGAFLASAGTGAYCVMIGVAGGSLATPILKACSMPMARALAIGSGTSLVVATLGTAGGIWNGWGIAGRPDWCLGFVDGIVVATMLPGVLLATAPGVALACRMEPTTLKRCYAGFLALMVVVMVGHLILRG